VGGAAARMKGIRWERACAQFYGLPTTRSLRPGVHDDGGDLDGTSLGLILECKDHGQWRVAHWFDELERKAHDDQVPVLLLKRRQQPTAAGLIVARMGDVDLRRL